MLASWLLIVLGCRCGEEPDSGWDPAQGEACLSCHNGIEQAHPAFGPGECTACHGGDGTRTDIERAHVQPPDDYAEIRGTGLPAAPVGYLKDMPPDMLDRIDPAYLRFINPGDIRVAAETCGLCHPDQVAGVRNSVMTTNAGHYMPTLYYAGIQGREAIYGSISTEDADYDGAEGTSPAVETLSPPDEDAIAAALASGDPGQLEDVAYKHYLAKNCNHCHAGGYGKNDARATYRSTGCSACHMLYSADGVYEGGDQAVPHNAPVYPMRHELTTAIPVEQCATCHFQGGRIGLLFRGIREGGFKQTPEHAELWNESVYGHTAGYYILDEDTTNDIDETPPDLHYAAGMHCVDCHVGTDVHGDGRIYATSKHQLDIRCEDCHGTVRQPITPDGDGVFRTASGRALPQLSADGDDVVLTGRVDGQRHIIPQPAEILTAGGTEAMHRAMGVDGEDWSHTDSLTCDTCHTSYNQQCIGCHVSFDLRLSQLDYQTGLTTPGLTRGSRSTWTLDHVLLCQAPDGRAQTCNTSQQTQLTVIDEEGEVLLGTPTLDEDGEPTGSYTGEFRHNDDYSDIIGWAPFFQHTASATPRACDTCHRQDDSADELTRVRGVYGYGTGEFMLATPDGGSIDALQFVDDEGQLTDFVHTGTGPLSEEVRQRALSVILDELKK
jgi:hypothetical protein